MIDIGNDNLDNELNIEKYKDKSTVILKNGVLIDLRTEEEINIERDFWRKSTKDKMFMTDKNNNEYRELPETADIYCNNISNTLKKFCFENDVYISSSDINLNSIENTGKINLAFKNKMKVNNPKELEYWRNIFPSKTDNELKEYIDRWGKENLKYLKFERL